MGKLKISKICSSIVVMLIMCMTLLNGKAYATSNEITERYVYDDTIDQEAFEYGTLYDEKTFDEINKDDMTVVYTGVLNDLSETYKDNDELLKSILLKQIQGINKSYTDPNKLKQLKTDWLATKVEYARNNMTIFEYANYNNNNNPSATFKYDTYYKNNKWSHDFYVNWHLLCCNWGTNLEKGKIIFKKMRYEYASPSQAFILNCLGDGYGETQKPIKNKTLHYFLTEKNSEKKSVINLSDLGRKTGLTSADNPTYLQYTEWHSEGGNVDNHILPTYPYYLDENVGEGTLIEGGNMYSDAQCFTVGKILGSDLSDISTQILSATTEETPIKSDIDAEKQYNFNNYDAQIIGMWGAKLSGEIDNIIVLEGDFSKYEQESNIYEQKRQLYRIDGKIVSGYLWIGDSDKSIALFGTKEQFNSGDDIYDFINKTTDETETFAPTGTNLNLVADAYEAFIKRIAELDKDNKFQYEDVYYNGRRFKFPKIDESKLLGKVTNKDRIVNFDKETQNFVIGPMCVGGSSAVFRLTKADGTVEEYEFAKLGDFKIQSNKGTLKKGQWQFLCNGVLQTDSPDSGEEFYIIVPYQEGLTEITNIDYSYKYLKAVANFYYFYEGITEGGGKAQEQRMLRDAARWYESIDLSYSEQNLELVKKVVDENGNELSADEVAEKLGGKKQYAYFKVKINYNGAKDANGNDIPDLDEIYEVEAGGDPIQVPVQKWDQEGTSSPHYTVKEVTFDGDDLKDDNDARWTLDRIENADGDLTGKNTVRVVGTNKLKRHIGELEITKKVQYENGQAVNVNEDTDFIFHLDILRKSDQKLVGSEDITLTVEAGSSTATATSGKYTWYGDDVLEYKLTETDSKGYISDGVKEGTLEAGKTVEVTCKNIDKPEPVTLTLKKSIKDGVKTDEKFTFRVKTEGAINNFGNTTEYVPIVLDAGQEATFTFTPKSKTTPVKYWVYEEIASGSKTQPNEFIVSKDGEIIADSDETIANSSPENGWYAIVEGKELTNGESVRVEAINEVTPTQGQLKLTKEFIDKSDKDRVATFKVTVEVPKEVNLEKLKIPDGFVQDTTTVYTSPDDTEATHYVTYVTGYVIAGGTKVTKWKTDTDIFKWDSVDDGYETWNSGNFEWYGDYDIKYHIEEQQVFEVDLNNQKAENVTNQYMSVISTPEGRGKLYENENLNLVHAYNGNKIVTLTVSKQLDPNGKIDNDQKFAFNVKVNGVTKVLTTRGGIDENGVFTDTPSDGVFTDKPSVSVNSPVTYVFEYEGEEPPTFEVKEIDHKNLVKIDVTNATGEVEDIKDDNSDKVIGKKGTLNPGAEVTVTATNKLQFSNNIVIRKTLDGGPASTKEIFLFDVHIEYQDGRKAEDIKDVRVTVEEGQSTGTSAQIGPITWYDEDKVPTYTVSNERAYKNEVKSENDITAKYKPTITPASGTLNGNASEIKVDVVNYENEDSGPFSNKIMITKKIAGNASNDEIFVFRVKVNEKVEYGAVKVEKGKEAATHYKTVSDINNITNEGWNEGNKWISQEYKWADADTAPNYSIEEVKAFEIKDNELHDITEKYNPTITPSSGVLDGSKTEINVDVVNYKKENWGKIKVTKDFLNDKELPDSNIKALAKTRQDSFKALITVKPNNGSLIYNNEIINDQLEIQRTLSSTGDWTFETDEIYWTGDNPTFTIEEISNSPAWSYVEGKLDGNTDTTNSLKGWLENGTTKEATINNTPRKAIILTMELGGMVWEDIEIDEATKTDDYKGKPNGVYDGKNDKLKENIEVRVNKKIYDSSDNEAGTVSYRTTRTDKDGRWEVTRVGVPVATKNDLVKLGIIGDSDNYDSTQYTADYDVEFVYDGQTYEPTDSVIYWDNGTKTGNASDFKSLKDTEDETKNNRAKYANSSMAKEVENNSEKITEIKGNMPIDDSGTTVGTVVTGDGENKTETDVIYKKTKDGYPLISELQTTYGENENVYDVFKATATTSAVTNNPHELTFPFEKDFSISADGYEIDLADNLKISTADDLIGVAGDCWKAIVDGTLINGGTYQYGGTSIPPKAGTIDCSSFISFVLYEYGYTEEFAGWQKATPWFINESNLANNMGWTYAKIAGGQNANDVIKDGIQPGDIVVRDNGAGGAYGHITFVKAVSGDGTTDRTYTLYDCGAQTNWTNPNNKNGITGKSSFIESDSRSGYVIRIGENKPVTITKNNTTKYEVTVGNNSIYKLYSSQDLNSKIDNIDNLSDGVYYLKNSIANYVIDNAGNYIVPNDSGFVKVTKNNDTYTIDPTENFIITDNYKAIYNYCKNINLGLVEKKPADAELEKRLTEAKVVVKEKMYQFKYNPNNSQDKPQQSALFKVIKDDELAQTYAEMNKLQINVPKSDYYYRAEIYNSTVGYTLEDYYNKKFSKTYDDTEMDIYLTYDVIVKNVCDGYNFTINSIDDYFSADLELVKDSDKYKVIDGEKKKVADKFAYTLIEQPGTIQGSDGIMYKKITISNLGIDNLKPNEKSKAISMTFKVDKSRFDKTIKLGDKANVAEIASYSTKYADGYVDYATGKSHTGNAGKIDRDSAPGNLNIKYLNDEKWYEDDTDSAFNVDIKLTGLYEEGNGTDRTIEGMVWEEMRTEEKDGYKYGNGEKSDDEKEIEGIKTELRERILIPNSDGTYTSHDALLQTDKPLASLGGQTFEQVTEETKNGNTLKFDSTTTTDASGKYTFTGVPVGDYVVRFTYGDKQIDSASYSTAKFYNGQDYKSSIYKLKDGDNETKLNLKNYNGVDDNHSNVAVDSEVRRLQVIQKSREITNENGRVLASSRSMEDLKKLGYSEEEIKQNKDKLLKDYYMYAETPMISFDDLGKTYNLKNIDFAIEERPLTELSLDKQIKEILITTSDGKTLMDAVYNITYSINEKGKITANVELDETKSIGTENLQALDRDKATNNGFRYINVDSEVLQGTTITVTYQLSAINSGEVDYTGKLADASFKINETEYSWNAEGFDKACEDLSTKLATYNNDKKLTISQGTYIGNHYYYGKDKEGVSEDKKDKLVTTSVKELVDYVDNDMTFDATLNSAQNTSWKTTTEFELKGLVENTGEIKDSNGTIFSTNGNLITSINDGSKNDIVGKELKTVRYDEYNGDNKYPPEAQIQLTISKFVSADSDTLQIDNIAEIIRYTNTVGRRDILTTTGNTDPNTVYKTYKQTNPPTTISGGYVPTVYERDTSATELITLSPPTGSSIFIWRLQVAGAITAAMAIVAGGIILIKKKVLK